ncbi:hypothetical protein J0X15_16335 [Roseibium sp. CAU 1637]|uniref:Uncharacterized protein n=2 Tax=Stappiaceae TaxID=2821832 RepID=A0A939EQC7_9HYPH|nr:hypothetical protein [Roseibium limicola]MBO0346796.1 hypothetical protein [Roseibium limicola]
MNRKRPSSDEQPQRRESRRPATPMITLEATRIEREHDAFIARYRPNAPFLAHLIATRDGDPQTRFKRTTEPEIGTSKYRETAARPRRREVGHVISKEF